MNGQGGIDGRHYARNNDAVHLADIEARRARRGCAAGCPTRRRSVRGPCASRHWKSSLRPSKAPIVMLLLPASRASSTYASCKNQGIGSIVFAHDEEARRVEARGGSVDGAARLVDRHAPSGGVAGSVGEEAENGLRVFTDDRIDGAERERTGCPRAPVRGRRAGAAKWPVGRCRRETRSGSR